MDDEGWVADADYFHLDAEDLFNIETESENLGYGNEVIVKWAPSLISKLIYNNGWTRIESEADLPTVETECWVMQGGRMYAATFWNSKFWHREVYKNVFPITHYQPIVKPEKPLY